MSTSGYPVNLLEPESKRTVPRMLELETEPVTLIPKFLEQKSVPAPNTACHIHFQTILSQKLYIIFNNYQHKEISQSLF